ncbi:phosphotransferase [Actinoplanes sp. NPDC051470]|uniref:phosphotransferase family protein n=1 Tax=Actinoplanes sp. NPDC051470 TaxID=3157224 RepID=UPI003413ED35
MVHNQGNPATGGVWRMPGGEVLKVARPAWLPPLHPVTWPTSDDPAHWNYWQREALAYRTGFAASVYADAGIVPPSLLRTADRPDGEIELWLAFADGMPGFSWPVARIAAFARQLGQAQAGWAGRVPAEPWLSRHWLAQYLSAGPADSVFLSPASPWRHPLWPSDALDRLRSAWIARPSLVARCDAVPRTLCHLDVWPNNLISSGGTSVLLDWAFCGDGGIGEDPANLIVDSFTDGLMDPSLLPELSEAVMDSYVEGLRDGGWTGSGDDVRRWIMLFGVTKYSWFAPALLGRMSRDGDLGQKTYGQDTSGDSAMVRLRGLITMLGEWAAAVR